MVPKGGRYATSDVQILGEAALRAVPVIGGARGDRTSQGTGPFHAGDWAPPRSVGLDNLPVNCGATQPPAAAGWSIGRRPPSGMPIDRPVAPNRPSLRSTQPCALMWRRDLLASSSPRVAFPFLVPPCRGRAAGMARERIGDGPGLGARSRLPGACRSTSRTTRRCASATKPSIRHCSFKVEERYAAN